MWCWRPLHQASSGRLGGCSMRDHKSEYEEDRNNLVKKYYLMKQPESRLLKDGPVCCLPFPLDIKKPFNTCCSKLICRGCAHANRIQEAERRIQPACPFCGAPMPTDEGSRRHFLKRGDRGEQFAIWGRQKIRY